MHNVDLLLVECTQWSHTQPGCFKSPQMEYESQVHRALCTGCSRFSSPATKTIITRIILAFTGAKYLVARTHSVAHPLRRATIPYLGDDLK